ncbi:MAG: COX15/CtaA family protein [Verrucomicrobia bacterium]|nr:COX15/CtaA family protein [Verrucomicrobiota bacterium]
MTGTVERGALVRRIAAFAAFGTFVIVVASAFLRLSAPHQDCADWPACYGRVTQAADGTEPSAARRSARLAHRIAATAVAAAILALAVVCFTRRPGSRTDRTLAVALVVLTGFLAVLGRWTPTGALLPAVTVGNLAGGFGLLALLWWLRLRHAEGPHSSNARSPRWLAIGAIALLSATAVLGALVSANYAALSCTTLPDCNGSWWPAPTLAAFDMLRPLGVDGAQRAQLAEYAPFLHMLHRYLAAASALAAMALGSWLLARGQGGRGLGAWMLALLALQIGLGVTAITRSLPLPVVVLHNGIAALLLIAVVTASYRLAPGRVAQRSGC